MAQPQSLAYGWPRMTAQVNNNTDSVQQTAHMTNEVILGLSAMDSNYTAMVDGDTDSYNADDTVILVQPDFPPPDRPPSGLVLRTDAYCTDTDRNVETSTDHCHWPRQRGSNLARNQLIIVSVFCLLFMSAEIVGGLLSNSLALVTDATHMACDLASFLVSLLAIWLATKPPTRRLSFGFYRAEVLGALVSVLIIWVVTGVLVYLAVGRVKDQTYEIEANEMLIVASIGVVFNIVMGFILHSGVCATCKLHTNFGHGHSHGDPGHSYSGHSYGSSSHTHSTSSHLHNVAAPLDDTYETNHSINRAPHNESLPPDGCHGDDVTTELVGEKREPQNINIRAALVHVIGDFVQSLGVLVAAVIIKVKPEYKLADPICTFVFSVLVLFTTVTVLRDVLLIFMEGVPRDVNYCAMKKDLESISGVKAAHSLNIWALTANKVAVTVHLAIATGEQWAVILQSGTRLLRNKYNVHQSTVQVEEYDHDAMTVCVQCTGPQS